MRPGNALVAGVRSLRLSAEIPEYFTESIVKRVSKVGDLTKRAPQTGLRSVELASLGDKKTAAPIDDQVDENAKKAVAPVSLAYGSVVGTLDVISARSNRIRVGLVTQYGPPVTCIVESLSRDLYLGAFNQTVLVEGVIKRNGSGQIIRIEADSLEVQQPPSAVQVSDLRGLWKGVTDLTVAQIIEEQRGR